MSEHPDEYEVGYKKPPKSGQFQPGKSGNPKGRPKKPQTQTPEGRQYSSLSKLAKEISGYAVSGPIFFGLRKPKVKLAA